jgi:hypothetical protein
MGALSGITIPIDPMKRDQDMDEEEISPINW